MTIQAIKLLLVEDSSVLAEHLTATILAIPQIELIGVVDSESAALAELKKRRVHIVILDLHLKQGTGFGILRALAGTDQKPQILVLTNHGSSHYEGNALALGATRFLDKANDFQRLPEILAELVRASLGK